MAQVFRGNRADGVSPAVTPRAFGDTDQLPQGNHRAYGVVLRRKEGSRRSQELLLFLKGMGTRWVSAPGAEGAKNRFGGGTEPLVWGLFDFYQSPRRLYLKSVDVREDFLEIRQSVKKLSTAIDWCKLLAKNIPTGHECDDLLALFWGSLKNLTFDIDARLADLRFVWRWGSLWGLAPSLENCCACGASIVSSEDAEVTRSEDGLCCLRCGSSRLSIGDLSPIPFAVLQEIRHAAMLPRDKFLIWAEKLTPETIKALGEYTRWFCAFLDMHE